MTKQKSFSSRDHVILTPPKAGEESRYEKLVLNIENYIDKEAVKHTDFKKGKNFEKIASELGI